MEYAKKEAEAKEKHIAEWEERKRTGTSFSGIGGMLGLSAVSLVFIVNTVRPLIYFVLGS